MQTSSHWFRGLITRRMGATLSFANLDVIAGPTMQRSCAWRTEDIIKWPRPGNHEDVGAASAEGPRSKLKSSGRATVLRALSALKLYFMRILKSPPVMRSRMAQTTAPDFHSPLTSSVEKPTWETMMRSVLD
ncbi:hypothetical protein DL765_008359 [Monosporascus sp. GIB2]|nr:hypothetical protein DL765_008359 [Monosporascus sp. GIB2]